MRSRHPACAVVSLAALDVRRRPEHRSELGSQLLLGEVVRILARSRDGLWHRLENAADGYAPRPAYRPLTKFERRGIGLGHGVWDVVFRRR